MSKEIYDKAYFLILYHKLRSLILSCCAALALLFWVLSNAENQGNGALAK